MLRRKYNTQKNWFDTPEGTKEEMEEAFEVTSSYLYKLLDYADDPEGIPQDVLDYERRIFSFAKVGPRAGYFRFDRKSKLVSADVLYILTCTLPAKVVGKKFGICERKIGAIRRGEVEEWYWEYALIKRIRVMLTARQRQANKAPRTRVFSISKLVDIGKEEILLYVTGLRKAKSIRQDIIPLREYKKLEENNTLDIVYPIKQIEVI